MDHAWREQTCRLAASHKVSPAMEIIGTEREYFDLVLKTADYYTKDVGAWGGKGAEVAVPLASIN